MATSLQARTPRLLPLLALLALLLCGGCAMVKMKPVSNTDYVMLKRGDILVTKTKGHTGVILDNGPKATKDASPAPIYALGDRLLRNGSEGEDVKL